jgi:ADP-heptose:LPS heptosyltransferase
MRNMPKAHQWQIWAKYCGETEQAVAAYAVLYDVYFSFYSATIELFSNNKRQIGFALTNTRGGIKGASCASQKSLF